MGARLADAGLSKLAVILIDGCLHLLEDAVDGGQVTSRFGVAHGWETVALHRVIAVVASDATGHGRDWLVGWHGRQWWLRDGWELKPLKLE